jgi:hypothetical protein
MQSFVSRPKKHRWVLLYEMAVYEIDDNKRLDLIALAKHAISQRKQALAHSKTDHIEEEAALDDAWYILAAFHKAAEFNRGGRQGSAGAPVDMPRALSRSKRMMPVQKEPLDNPQSDSETPSNSEVKHASLRSFASSRLRS